MDTPRSDNRPDDGWVYAHRVWHPHAKKVRVPEAREGDPVPAAAAAPAPEVTFDNASPPVWLPRRAGGLFRHCSALSFTPHPITCLSE
jgi:hypothetical protein